MSTTFADLKEAYENAVKNNEETFELDNRVYLTTYAKYLIQYLTGVGISDKQVLEAKPRRE